MRRPTSDALLAALLRASAGVAAFIVLLIAGFLLREAWSALTHVGLPRFFTDAGWHPQSDGSAGAFNLSPLLVGTLAATFGALLLAAPLGIASALFCQCYAPPGLAALYRRLVELLAGIPSVVYGFWGLVVLVPLIRALHPPGPSLLAGVLIVALMILPTVALMADAALAAVPPAQRRAAAALGLGRWTTATQVLLPAARSGVFAGVLLGAGRAAGETLAILMVAGNLVQIPSSVFDPIRTLTANIALEMAYAQGDQRSALFVCGLLLLALVTLLVLAASHVQRASRAALHHA